MSTTPKYQPNNYIVLTGNTGAEAKVLTSSKTGKEFVSISLYTSNVRIDEQGNKEEYPSTLHNIVAYSPYLMKELLAFKAGARLRIKGKLGYRTFDALVNGETVKKKEAVIVAKKVETAVLPSKQTQSADPTQQAVNA